MASQVYLDQSADSLRLSVVQGAVDKSQLNVLSTGSAELSNTHLEAGIIGASHYFELRMDGQVVLTEVFACTEIVSENLYLVRDLKESGKIGWNIGNLSYWFSGRKLDWSKGKEVAEKIAKGAKSIQSPIQVGLDFIFPSVGKEEEFPARTTVVAKLDPNKNSAKVETLHAYPNERILVFTETNVLF